MGDSGVDVLTGRNAGTWTCGVTYGFAPHTLHDAPPDVVLDQAVGLAELFEPSQLPDSVSSVSSVVNSVRAFIS